MVGRYEAVVLGDGDGVLLLVAIMMYNCYIAVRRMVGYRRRQDTKHQDIHASQRFAVDICDNRRMSSQHV